MSIPVTTKMSTKGQVVIPESLRKSLSLEPGARFLVMGEGDVLVLKKIEAPSMKDFNRLIRDARRQAREAGLEPADVRNAIRRARSGK